MKIIEVMGKSINEIYYDADFKNSICLTPCSYRNIGTVFFDKEKLKIEEIIGTEKWFKKIMICDWFCRNVCNYFKGDCKISESIYCSFQSMPQVQGK